MKKNNLIILTIVLSLFWISAQTECADKVMTIVLKSGKVITGNVINYDKDKKTIKLNVNEKPFIFNYGEGAQGPNAIDRIIKENTNESASSPERKSVDPLQQKQESTKKDDKKPEPHQDKSGNLKNICKDSNFGPFVSQVQRKIKNIWHPQRLNSSKKVVVLFTVSKEGELLNLKVMKSSGIEKMDDEAIKTVRDAAPFGFFPDDCKKASIDIQFSFDYNLSSAPNKKR